jgi:predicted MFS family arabinose efflux permease
VPLGAVAGQLAGWRGPFWALAVLALAAIPLLARHVPHEDRAEQAASQRSELAALRSGRLWLVLAACATTTGGVLSAYSYITALLTDRTGISTGISTGLVPLVLVGFGLGSLIGTILGGRLGDARPQATTALVPAVTTGVLLGVCLLATHTVLTVALVVLLGVFGLSANPVLSSLAVRYAGPAPTLGVAMSVSAYNLGTAVGSAIAGATLSSGLAATGPAAVGAGIAALTPVPAITLARLQRRRHAARPTVSIPSTAASCCRAA